MTHFLVSESNPKGFKLEDILTVLRRDVLVRCNKIADDPRPEARQVLDNNMKVLQLITEAIHIAESSTRILDKSFGPSSLYDGKPRIGVS
ncbi:MAG: histidine kinase [Alphaproteobacteria bacterium]|nr:histidine kinase [Alphaproteobacteria bacterium]